jgi:hypothetical protein
MKKLFNWQFKLAAGLLLLSALFYLTHYLIFRNGMTILDWFINNLAFIFINVLIVTLILQRLLEYREKEAVMKKMNMVIGTFFSEVGVEAMKMFSRMDRDLPALGKKLLVSKGWSDKDFAEAIKNISSGDVAIENIQGVLPDMKNFLLERRAFLLGLLQNPNLLEHESFTELLWAVFHLTDELAHRKTFENAAEPDLKHLDGDINRAYKLIIIHWLYYMKHLKIDYPYLFSLAVRTNPFDEKAEIEVK